MHMANIQTRTTADNRVMYTARIRIKGFPPSANRAVVCGKTLDRCFGYFWQVKNMVKNSQTTANNVFHSFTQSPDYVVYHVPKIVLANV